MAALALLLLLAGCSDDDVPEPTVEERLEAIEGRPLTPSEVKEKLAVAAAICQLDEPILDQVWQRLDEDQLAFQDFVFDHECPERSTFYAGLTGRYVTDEARESGVVTSTTRPTTTTTAPTASTTTPRPSIVTVPDFGTLSPSEDSTEVDEEPATPSREPSTRGTTTSQGTGN